MGPDSVVERVLSSAKEGSIVLFHNAAKDTPPALPRILKKLTESYSVVPVSQLIYRENFTINHEGKQIKAENPPES